MMRCVRTVCAALAAVGLVTFLGGCDSSSKGSGAQQGGAVASVEKVKEQVRKGTVILVMGKRGCKSCQEMEPVIAQASSATGVKIVKQFPDNTMMGAFGVSSFPTIIIYNNGAECERWVGYRSVGEMTEMVERCKKSQSN